MSFFKKSWTISHFYGAGIRLHISMLLVLPLGYYLFRPNNIYDWLLALLSITGLFVCVLLHELGHAVVIQKLGIKVKQIVLWPLGGFTQLERSPSKPLHDLLVSGAGPLVSILLALLFGMLWLIVEFTLSDWYSLGPFWNYVIPSVLLYLAIINVVLVIFNLLPIYSLDGGGMLHALAEMAFGKSVASQVSILVAIPFLLGLIAFGLWIGDYLLLVVTIFLALGVGILDPRFRRWFLLVINYFFKRSGFHHLNEDFDEAIRHHTLAIDKNPNDIASLLGRAIAYVNTDEIELALRDIETILALDPQHITTLVLRGELYGLKKKYELAIADFNRVRELKPEWSFPYFDIGNIYLDQEEYEKALQELDHAIELEKQHPLFYLVRSIAYFRLNNLAAAHRDQAEAIRLSPKHALTMIDASLNFYKDNLDWALDYYAWVLARKPKQWLAYQGRADAYLVNDQPEAGLADYDRAIQLAPSEAILYLRRGQAYQKLGNLENARDDFQRALKLSKKAHLHRQAERRLAQVSG
jgi:Zn-dependent protease/Tfp pilus assembly protein PilF